MASEADESTMPEEPKRQATNGSNQADPVGSRPLSVSEQEIPHHPGADPTVKSDTPEPTTDESATTEDSAGS